MYRKALVVTGLDEPSERFLRCKAGLLQLGVQETVLGICVGFHVIPGLQDNLNEILKPEIERRHAALENQGYRVEVELILGDPGREANRLAEEKECDLVVVGSQVHSLAGEIFFGGASGEVLHRCRRPLLATRIHIDADCPPDCPLAKLQRILFPTDFSENAEHAFSTVVDMAESAGASVVLMHVQDRSKIEGRLKDRIEEFNTIDRDRLERMKAHLVDHGIADVEIELSYGLPTEEILRRSRQGDISLTVMGNQGRGFVAEMFLGSVSHNIARNAPTPTLLIPAVR